MPSPRRQDQTPNCTQSIAWCVKLHTHTHSYIPELGAELEHLLGVGVEGAGETLSGLSETLSRAIQTREGGPLQARDFPECKSEGEGSH